MALVEIKCPACKSAGKLSVALMGRTIKCRKCTAAFVAGEDTNQTEGWSLETYRLPKDLPPVVVKANCLPAMMEDDLPGERRMVFVENSPPFSRRVLRSGWRLFLVTLRGTWRLFEKSVDLAVGFVNAAAEELLSLRFLGFLLVLFGTLASIYYWSMDVTVEVAPTYLMGRLIGGGGRVVNMHLMHQQQVGLIASLAVVLIGVILLVTSRKK